MSGVKKIQITFQADEFDEIEKKWMAYGFSNLSEALRVVARGNLNEHIKEMRRVNDRGSEMLELNKKKLEIAKEKEDLEKKLQEKPKNERTKTLTSEQKPKVVGSGSGKYLSREDPKIETALKSLFDKRGITEEQYHKAKGYRIWTNSDGVSKSAVWY